MTYTVTTIPGDGVGPEVTAAAVKVLETAGAVFGHTFTFIEAPAGGCAIDAFGMPLPDRTLETCRAGDAVFLGAVGGPRWDRLEGEMRPESGLLKLRKGLGLYANIRPSYLHESLKDACPLRPEIAGPGIDICIVRELAGGIYFGERGRRTGPMGEEAFDTECYSRQEAQRIARVAFRLSQKRRKKLTSVDKANVLQSSRLWRDAVTETAAEFPDVELGHMYVDNAAMQLIRDPRQFDVIVTTNMFGDILSDEASTIAGSIGMLPSASLGDGPPGLYEPIHGSAPEIAGRDIANPLASILSAAMMLRHSFGLEAEAAAVDRAVGTVLDRGFRTADIRTPGGRLVGTREMTRLVVEEIRARGGES
jgi:3-isopropylmalate dehydrogenase